MQMQMIMIHTLVEVLSASKKKTDKRWPNRGAILPGDETQTAKIGGSTERDSNSKINTTANKPTKMSTKTNFKG